MSQEKQSFIDRYSSSAVAACEGTGLFPSIMIAQALLESGFGKSTLASKYNNFFGIKANSAWKGKKVYLKNGKNDPEDYSYYRVYANATESFRDRVKFLQENSRYAKAGVFAATSPLEQIKAMKKAGYAQDSEYVNKIMAEVRYYGLASYDNLKDIAVSGIAIAAKAGKKMASKIGILIAGAVVTFCLYQIGITYYPQYSLSRLWQKQE